MGPHKDSEARYYTQKSLYWAKDKIKILGINMSNKLAELFWYNYDEILEKAKTIMNKWKNKTNLLS